MANPWKPGQSGNPAGRPKGSKSHKTEIYEMWESIKSTPVGKQGNPFAAEFTKKLMDDALKGKPYAVKFFAEHYFSSDIEEKISEYLDTERDKDRDFLSYRVYKQCHSIQQQILVDHSNKIYLMAGRRSGKSEADQFKGIEKAITTREARILYIGLTITKCEQIFRKPIEEKLTSLGIKHSFKAEGYLELENGSQIYFGGNSTMPERDRYRGFKWDLVFIDEAQSQPALPILIHEILEPTLLDRKGTLVLSGTGPKIRGTYWEEVWTNIDKYKATRYNWNITQNPFIPDYEEVLEKIKKEHSWADTDPTYLREYLGKISYDDDAMLYRFTDANFYTEQEFTNWINGQPIGDIKFTAGLDYGFADYSAFNIICYSESKPEKFVIWEDKFNRSSVTELAERVKKGIEYVATSQLFNRTQSLPNMPFTFQSAGQMSISKDFYIFCDTNEQMISKELYNTYGIPTLNAIKYEKALAIEMLQEEVRRGYLKVKDKNSHFYDESLKTVWKRDDKDELTHEIDNDTFHPDMMDSVLYALRQVWIYSNSLGK